MTKVEIGRYYRNVPTGQICKVTGRKFFAIQYEDVEDISGLNPRCCHYKKFKKHWELIDVPRQVGAEPGGEGREPVATK